MKKLLLVLVLCAASEAVAAQPYVQLSGTWTTLGGTVLTDGRSRGPVEVDFANDIGFDNEIAWEGRAGFMLFGRNRISVGGAMFDHEITGTLDDFTFEGQTYDASASLTNHLRWVEAEYGLSLVKSTQVRFEVLAGVRLFHYTGVASGRISPPVKGFPSEARTELDEQGPVPHVGAAVEVNPIPQLVLRGMAKGFFIGLKDTKGNEIDFEATLGFRFGKYFEIGAGYRNFSIFVSADGGDTELDFRYSGVTAYARIGG